MAGRPAYVYRVDIPGLLRAGLVVEHISIEGNKTYRARGRLEDVIHGVGWQCDRMNELDVRPGTLHKLAMIDGLTYREVMRIAMCSERQAQRYMRKLKTIAHYSASYV